MSVSVGGEQYRKPTKLKFDPGKWDKENKRATGKGSIIINKELERISEDFEKWVTENPVHNYSEKIIENKINQVIKGTQQVEKRKSIDEYFELYLNEKEVKVNPVTKRRISPKVIRYHRNAFRRFQEWKIIELEEVTETNYHSFLSFLLETDSVNHSGKIISNLKVFFKWCDKKGMPVSSEYALWKTVSEETDEEVRALNSDQLRRIYELKIDPIDVYEIAKNRLKKKPDSRQVESLCKTLEEVRRQAVAMCSIPAHRETFWKLELKDIHGNTIKYRRGKNNSKCSSPFIDNSIFHCREYANMSGGRLFKRITGINNYLKYIRYMCDIPFHITCKTFRKTWGSIIWYELPDNGVNKMAIIMKGYGHTRDIVTRKYLGIQDDDLQRDHELLFGGI